MEATYQRFLKNGHYRHQNDHHMFYCRIKTVAASLVKFSLVI